MSAEDRYCPRCGLATFLALCPRDGTSTLARTTIDINPQQFRPGDVISGRYRVVKLLGRGGYGAVFAAEHTGTGQPCALKVLAADPGGLGDENQRRFFREAAITAGLKHPNTVRVYDFGQAENGALFMALELIEGPTLAQKQREFVMRGKAMPEHEVVDMGIAVLRALGEAHAAQLVHRDLKPANIMYSAVPGEDPVVKVLDFGIVRARDSSLTATGTALGTPEYMSPEQCSGEEMDGRSDLYSLGVILWESVTGRLPFIDEKPLRVMLMQMSSPPPELRMFARTGLSDAFVDVVQKAMAKSPYERFHDAREMRTALEHVKAISTEKPRKQVKDLNEEWAPTMLAQPTSSGPQPTQPKAPEENVKPRPSGETQQPAQVQGNHAHAGPRTHAQAQAPTQARKTASREKLPQWLTNPAMRKGAIAGTALLATLLIFAGGYYAARNKPGTVAVSEGEEMPEQAPAEKVARFELSPSGELVRDNRLKLTWQRQSSPAQMAFPQASHYCNVLNLEGRGWRLPNKPELLGLAQDVDTTLFADAQTGWFWTGTPFQNSATNAWGVDFEKGQANPYEVAATGHVRCVK